MKSLTGLFLIPLALTIWTRSTESYAIPTLSPEKESVYLSHHLKPIPDDEWKSIAGERVTEKYTVTKGDTLYDLSKRLFGDPKYWPKIWALNNGVITNPHVIRPGNLIAFMPGTGSSLPGVQVNNGEITANDAGSTSANGVMGNGSSDEWRNLPRQPWEKSASQVPVNVDRLGFVRENHLAYKTPVGLDIPGIVSSEKIVPLGIITGARTAADNISLGDTVFIQPQGNESFQVGEQYTLISSVAAEVKAPKDSHPGYSYVILGKVKILTVRDGMFVGTLTEARDFLPRGTFVIPFQPRITDLTPIPGIDGVKGTLLIDHRFSTFTTAQFLPVVINRGSNDGVKPNMVFRSYGHNDPSTSKLLSSANFIVDADILILQVSTNHSLGMVIDNVAPIDEFSDCELLVDVSDLLRNKIHIEKNLNAAPNDKQIDELDQLEGPEGLGTEEERELKQLEKWKGNPQPESTPPPTPSDKTEEVVPPPPPPPPALANPPEPPKGSNENTNELMPPPPTANGDDLPPPPPPSQ